MKELATKRKVLIAKMERIYKYMVPTNVKWNKYWIGMPGMTGMCDNKID